jgi:CDP-diacylglycerol--glycerol-3-phosphate 3-phosphatidyltransferase
MSILITKIFTPNNLTLARLGLSVIFFILLAYAQPGAGKTWLFDLAAALFLLAALTDLADGYLARKYKMVTALGRLLDPFADKILIGGSFIFFCGTNFVVGGVNVTDITPWIVTVIVGRELLVTTLRGHSEASGIAFPATFSGKLKMFLQTATVIAILISIGHFPDANWARQVRLAFIWIMVFSTVGSMLSYMWKYYKFQTQRSAT